MTFLPNASFRKRSGASAAGMFGLAAAAVMVLCGAGSVPIKNFSPQGAMQADLNAGGHAVTNAAAVSAATLTISGTAALPANTTIGGTSARDISGASGTAGSTAYGGDGGSGPGGSAGGVFIANGGNGDVYTYDGTTYNYATGGNAGTINLSGGNADAQNYFDGGAAGTLSLRGSSPDPASLGNGGPGGTISANGYENYAGGSFNSDAGMSGAGGSLTMGNNGGSINTANGGGAIDTLAGTIDLGPISGEGIGAHLHTDSGLSSVIDVDFSHGGTVAMLGDIPTVPTIAATSQVLIGDGSGNGADSGGYVPVVHLVGEAAATSVTTGTGAGTGGSASLNASASDLAATVTLVTGTSPAASAAAFTLTFANSYGSAPSGVEITPCNAAAAALEGAARLYPSSVTSTGVTFSAGATALGAATTYEFSIVVIQ